MFVCNNIVLLILLDCQFTMWEMRMTMAIMSCSFWLSLEDYDLHMDFENLQAGDSRAPVQGIECNSGWRLLENSFIPAGELWLVCEAWRGCRPWAAMGTIYLYAYTAPFHRANALIVEAPQHTRTTRAKHAEALCDWCRLAPCPGCGKPTFILRGQSTTCSIVGTWSASRYYIGQN